MTNPAQSAEDRMWAKFDVFDSFSDDHWRAESAALTEDDES